MRPRTSERVSAINAPRPGTQPGHVSGLADTWTADLSGYLENRAVDAVISYIWARTSSEVRISKRPSRNNFAFYSGAGMDGVIPLRADLVGGDGQELHFGGGIVAFAQRRRSSRRCRNAQTGFRRRGADEVEDGLVGAQRLAFPVLADFRQEPMLDGVPLRGARWIVADGDGDTEWVG